MSGTAGSHAPAEHVVDERLREQHDARRRGERPQQRRAVRADEQLRERRRPPADRADRRVDRDRDDLVGAVDVPRERRGERDEADRREAVVEIDRENLALEHDERRERRREHPDREAQVAPRGRRVPPQGERVRRRAHGRDHAREVPHRRADHEAPHARAAGGERHRHGERDDRDDALQQALAGEVHAAEEDPGRRLERERERQVRGRGHEGEQSRVAVERRDDRRQRAQDQREDGRDRELEREGALELERLLGLVLGDERLVDAHPLEADDGHRRHGHDAVEPDRRRAQQPRDDQPLGEHEEVDPRKRDGVDQRAADDPPPQLAARDRRPVGGGRVRGHGRGDVHRGARSLRAAAVDARTGRRRDPSLRPPRRPPGPAVPRRSPRGIRARARRARPARPCRRTRR